MAASVTFTFVPGTDIEAGEVNQNFKDLIDFLNGIGIVSAPVTVDEGGTGAITAPQALTNLGAAPLASPNLTGSPQAPASTVGGHPESVIATIADLNAAIPNLPIDIADGGTGAANALDALNNLGGVSLNQFIANRILAAAGNVPILQNGLTIKWGIGTAPITGTGVSTAAVTFPVAYATSFFGASIMPLGTANSGAGGQPTSGYRASSNAGFTAVLDVLGSTTFNQAVLFFWIALGQ